MSTDSVDRRTFVKASALAGVGAWMGARPSPAFALRGSANEKLRVAVIGVNSRGQVHLQGFGQHPNTEVAYVVDVDSQVLAKWVAGTDKIQGKAPKGVVDFRRALDDKDVDAVVIAAPDHWHAPMAILALKAGKHVYLEKPASFDAAEGELLVQAQKKYGKVVQMGNQQRSDPRSIEVVQAIKEGGLIGRPYYARTWYSNRRGSIGRGKQLAPPAHLNYELWQGPAPRRPYQDNLVHYNWHWFYNYGTGEISNNGTHELDVARWALGVDYPVRVTSVGGRYHFEDDWEFPDTQDAGFEFAGKKTIVWQGRSCNGFPVENRDRGTSIHGTGGTVVLDRNGYVVYDDKNKKIKDVSGDEQVNQTDTRGGDKMTERHIANFVAAVRTGETLRAPIVEGHKSTLLTHLGNIAQREGRALKVDSKTGRIVGDTAAERHWGRSAYAAGWKPTL